MAKYKPRDGSIKFKEATQNMNNKEKMDYIWEYYKWWILASITAILVIFYMINTQRLTTHLHIAITSGFEHTGSQFQLDESDDVDEEASEFGAMPTNPNIFRVDAEALSEILGDFLLADDEYDEYTVTIQPLSIDFETLAVFSTLAGAGELDIIITYQHDFDAMASVGHFRSISDLDIDLPDHILTCDYGISLKYLPVFDDYIHPSNSDIELVLGVAAGSSRIQEVEDFLNLFITQ